MDMLTEVHLNALVLIDYAKDAGYKLDYQTALNVSVQQQTNYVISKSFGINTDAPSHLEAIAMQLGMSPKLSITVPDALNNISESLDGISTELLKINQ